MHYLVFVSVLAFVTAAERHADAYASTKLAIMPNDHPNRLLACRNAVVTKEVAAQFLKIVAALQRLAAFAL